MTRYSKEQEIIESKQATYQPGPRYDEVYYEGLAWLDDLENTGDMLLYYSEIDRTSWGPENSPEIKKCAQELLVDMGYSPQ